MAISGYDVVLNFGLVDMASGAALHTGTMEHENVQPPSYCHDDPADLIIQLQCIASLRTLYHFRREVKDKRTVFHTKLKDKKFTVQAISMSYKIKEQEK
jgi:hypothetical protein